jgi:hypothetical protein
MLLFYLCSCVCVLWFGVRLTGIKGKDVMTPHFNNDNLNHPFTGSTLHMVASVHPFTGTFLRMVASKSTPERIEVSCQIGIHSVLTFTHGTVLAFPQKILLLQI